MNYKEYVDCLKRKISGHEKDLIFICIGKSEILWDSIGPKVGSYLSDIIGKNYVLGDMKNNVCSKLDLVRKYPLIRKKFIVAIDVALSDRILNEDIFINKKPIIMGMGINKNKGSIGDIGIKIGISTLKIKNIDAKYVNTISKFVANGVLDARNNKIK